VHGRAATVPIYPEVHGQQGEAGGRQWVYDLDLPDPEAVSWTIGRLIFWSNDLLRELAGPGFQDMEHVAEFLWWAKDVKGPAPTEP
jgi:hypothetical protein